MSFIRWWTVGVMLMAATMSLTIGVVCLLYWAHRDESPEIPAQLPGLIQMTLLFLLLSGVGFAAFVPLRRANRWLWPTQALLLVSAVTIGMTFWNMLRA
ncbi:MAG: hypothetical protein E6R07_09165 [Nevskiaceae bacterium]|nr:MAG: hypothetical protein E6R07_09165 [Nevskiaceae bacterium]